MRRAQYWTAAAWLLERKYPMEYGKMERTAEDSSDAPVQLTLELVIEPMADDADGEQAVVAVVAFQEVEVRSARTLHQARIILPLMEDMRDVDRIVLEAVEHDIAAHEGRAKTLACEPIES